MTLVSDVGIWKIVAHIAFKFYSVASGTFSTGSTTKLTCRAGWIDVEPRKAVMPTLLAAALG